VPPSGRGIGRTPRPQSTRRVLLDSPVLLLGDGVHGGQSFRVEALHPGTFSGDTLRADAFSEPHYSRRCRRINDRIVNRCVAVDPVAPDPATTGIGIGRSSSVDRRCP
jgi:hypothetical protein